MSDPIDLDIPGCVAEAFRQDLLKAGIQPPEDADSQVLGRLLSEIGGDPVARMIEAITKLVAGAKLPPVTEIVFGGITEVPRTPETDAWDEIFAKLHRA